MKNSIKWTLLTFAVGIVTVTPGCKKDKDDDVAPTSTHTSHAEHVALSFDFAHTVGVAAVEMDTILYTNAASNMYSVATLKYFVSDITLHHDTNSLIIDAAHYVDIEDASTLTFSPTDEIPNGVYDSITLTFGLDTIKGADGSFVNAPESNMAWPAPMGGGYHYMKLEGQYDSAGVTNNFNAHFGPAMGMPHFVKVTLPASNFIAHGDNLNVNVVMDINKWFTSPMMYDFDVYTGMVMMNMSAQMALKANGADVFTVTSIDE